MNTSDSSPQARDANIEWKARLLIVFMLVLVASSVLFVLFARGAFDATQKLVLMADDSEGVVIGMDLTFSGFPIGRVQRIELAEFDALITGIAFFGVEFRYGDGYLLLTDPCTGQEKMDIWLLNVTVE